MTITRGEALDMRQRLEYGSAEAAHAHAEHLKKLAEIQPGWTAHLRLRDRLIAREATLDEALGSLETLAPNLCRLGDGAELVRVEREHLLAIDARRTGPGRFVDLHSLRSEVVRLAMVNGLRPLPRFQVGDVLPGRLPHKPQCAAAGGEDRPFRQTATRTISDGVTDYVVKATVCGCGAREQVVQSIVVEGR